MSLRMNIYGWSLTDFRNVLGNNDAVLLDKATALVHETLPNEPARSQAVAWLQTLLKKGFPLQSERGPAAAPVLGDLVTVKMENEAHVFAIYCLARAIAREGQLDLAGESSEWSQPAVNSLYRELGACGFTKSKDCCVQYFTWMSSLSRGTPLFGDDFQSEWSYYTVFSNRDLANMIPVFQAAADFKRTLPDNIPEEHARTIATELTDQGKVFLRDLGKWFGQIQQAGQDALILWH